MNVVILCGGLGTRFREETERQPKPMIKIGGMPILWHIMKGYAMQGFHNFILCLGYRSESIKEYFYHYPVISSDFTIELGSKDIQVHTNQLESGWKISLIDTGLNAMTGSRVKQIEKYIEGDLFMLTYGDGLIQIDFNELLMYHKSHGKIGTVTGVFPPSRYGELVISDDQVLSFQEKQDHQHGSVSGGYFVFNKEFFRYLQKDHSCSLEKEPLETLASQGQLKVFQHKGFWQCMDTYRDYMYLQSLWEKGQAPWKTW